MPRASCESRSTIPDVLAVSETGLTRVISAAHEFGTEWHRFLHPKADATSQELTVKLDKRLFPFMFEERDLNVRETKVVFILDDAPLYTGGDNLAITFRHPDSSTTTDDRGALAMTGDQPGLEVSMSFTLEQEIKEIDVAVEETSLSSIAPALVEVQDGMQRLNTATIKDVLLVLNYIVAS
jgi:hypothetical protein